MNGSEHFGLFSNLEFSDLTATVPVTYRRKEWGQSERPSPHNNNNNHQNHSTIYNQPTNQPTGGAKSKYCDCVGYVGRGPGNELNIVGRMKIVFHATEKNIGVYTKHSSTQVGIGIFFAMSRWLRLKNAIPWSFTIQRALASTTTESILTNSVSFRVTKPVRVVK